MVLSGSARPAAQHVLVDHEFAVVFADRAGRRLETGIRCVRALGPFPVVAEQTLQAISDNRFYIITHANILPSVKSRGEDVLLQRNPTDPMQKPESKPV